MKVKLTFKTPDILNDWQEQTLERYCNGELDGLGRDYDMASEEIFEIAKDIEKRFVEYGEYISVEFDTEAKTAKVLERQ